MKINYLSTKKSLRQSSIILGLFLFMLLIGIIFGTIQNAVLTGAIIGLMFGSLFFLIPAYYYLIIAIILSKKSNNCEKQICKVNNWSSWARMFGRVSVLIEDKEYPTAAYFTGVEARSFVGKDISFCIIGETLFIFEVVRLQSQAKKPN